MYEYLQDAEFLYAIDRIKRREQFAKITILSFSEEPIREIQGIISGGSLSVNGSAAIRRTISLTIAADLVVSDIENIDNLFSINKKIKVEIGYSNPLKKYSHYGDVIWFPCGTFVLSNASISNATNGCSITINGKDKMVLLDGSVGGMLPASVTFHEIYNYDKDGNVTITYPLIGTIIREAVAHYGGECDNNIFINDIDETAKMLIKYSGSSPIWFTSDFHSFVISDTPPGDNWNSYETGTNIGYKETDFTYPGELVLSAGESVTALLDKIVTTLGGNYEYYYDVNGRFIFQEKKNYQNNSYTPIVELGETQYIRNLTDTKYAYAFKDAETIISISKNPGYDKIKNDFICWGTKQLTDSVSVAIRYHLAIDNKPFLDKALMNMYAVKVDDTIMRYEFLPTTTTPQAGWELVSSACGYDWADWREELYRNALVNNLQSIYGQGRYDEELIAEWRKLYDPDKWGNNSTHKGWNSKVFTDPSSLTYWLDFIDSGAAIGKYSIDEIGRRSKVVNNNDVHTVYNNSIPDIIFVENNENSDSKIQELNKRAQDWCLFKPEQDNYFLASSTGASAYDIIREALYQNLNYNTTINISCIPIYYLEPNNLIYIQDKKTNTNGNYIVTQYTLPLTYNGTMSITAQESLTRV